MFPKGRLQATKGGRQGDIWRVNIQPLQQISFMRKIVSNNKQSYLRNCNIKILKELKMHPSSNLLEHVSHDYIQHLNLKLKIIQISQRKKN